MLILVENGDVYTPKHIGITSVLIDHDKIIKVGEVDRRGLDLLKVEYQVIDAKGCYVTPGLIDPHQHLLGGSGEGSLSMQSPMIFLSEIVTAGITTIAGVLGVDTTMKTIAGLLARVKALKEEGLNTKMWSGGYNVPPTTVLGSIREDMMYMDEVIGCGEVAISDERSLQVEISQLAQLVLDTHIGGLLSGKAGITHFHVGESNKRLDILRRLINEFDIDVSWLYPTHITRSEKLLDEAIELVKQGAYVDTDTIDGKLARWIKYYLEHGGDPAKLTLSSDCGLTSPHNLFQQFRDCILNHQISLHLILPMVTTNTAKLLKLNESGELKDGKNGELLVLKKDSLDIIEVISTGKRMMKDGRVVVNEKFLETSDRKIELTGDKFKR